MRDIPECSECMEQRLKKINEHLPQQSHPEWMNKIKDYKAKYPLTYHKDVLTGPFAVEEIYRQTNGEAIITTEVGQHQMWAAQYYKYTKPRTLLTSGGLVVNNHVLGMVRQWQDLFYDERYSATVLRDAVDYVKLAEAMGAVGLRATTQEEFKECFAKALTCGKPVLIDCMIDCDDKVWPMVAPGAPISEAFDEQDLKAKEN